VNLRAAALALGAALFAGGTPAQPPPAPPPPATLSPGDALLVRIQGMGGGIPEYREVVDSEGCIEIPFVGFLTAAGRTPADVADGMRTAYAAAGLASNAEIRLTYVTHFDPPPPVPTSYASRIPANLSVPDPTPSCNPAFGWTIFKATNRFRSMLLILPRPTKTFNHIYSIYNMIHLYLFVFIYFMFN